MSKIWPSTDLIGGGFGALDAIDGALLGDGDGAIVITQDKNIYHYTLDATSGVAEDVPNVIIPDANPGTKRWLLAAQPLSSVNYIGFNPNPTGVPTAEGTISHDPETHMPVYKSDIAGTSHNFGLEDWTRVRNMTGVLIPDGTLVVGFDSDIPDVFDVVPALAVPGPLASMAGVATSDIPPYEEGVEIGEGWVATRGYVHNLDTSGESAMTPVYMSATVNGEWTTTPPSPPNYAISIGFIAQVDDAVGSIYIFAINPGMIIAVTDAAVASGDPTGFHDGDAIDVSYDPITRIITLTGDLQYSWRGQVNELESPWVSDPHPDILDKEYYLHSDDGKTFQWTDTPWDFFNQMVAFVRYGTNDKYAIREPHGLMGWQTHQEFHQTNGTYRVSGGDVAGYVLDSTTPAERRPTVTIAGVKDEDNITSNALLDNSLYTRGYLTGSGILEFVKDDTDITALDGNIPLFNEFDGNNWIQTEVAPNQYMSIWLVAIPVASDAESQKYRYLWIQGQNSGSLATQEALVPEGLTLGNFQDIFTEFVYIEQMILRYQAGNWNIAQSIRLTGTRNQQIGSPSGNYLSVVTHDETLSGEGTVANPLSVVGDGGGEFTEITRQTITSSVGAVTFLNVFTDTFSRYRARVENLGASAVSAPRFRLGHGAGPTWFLNEITYHTEAQDSNSSAYKSSASAGLKDFCEYGALLTSTRGMSIDIIFKNLRDLSNSVRFNGEGTTDDGSSLSWNAGLSGAMFDLTNKVDHIEFFNSAGTIDKVVIIIEGAP